MSKKLKTVTLVLGIGSFGYWLFQVFRKSDHTLRGTLRTAGEDMHTGYDSSRQAAKHAISALRAGVREWSKERTADQLYSPGVHRGNGGTLKGNKFADISRKKSGIDQPYDLKNHEPNKSKRGEQE